MELRRTAHLLANQGGQLLDLPPDAEERLQERIPEIGDEQAGATLAALAAGLPVFEAHFDLADKVTVREARQIEGG